MDELKKQLLDAIDEAEKHSIIKGFLHYKQVKKVIDKVLEEYEDGKGKAD